MANLVRKKVFTENLALSISGKTSPFHSPTLMIRYILPNLLWHFRINCNTANNLVLIFCILFHEACLLSDCMLIESHPNIFKPMQHWWLTLHEQWTTDKLLSNISALFEYTHFGRWRVKKEVATLSKSQISWESALITKADD